MPSDWCRNWSGHSASGTEKVGTACWGNQGSFVGSLTFELSLWDRGERKEEEFWKGNSGKKNES